jgi:sodium-dependent dicarboxylate transporter 2/3/5
MFVLWVLSSWIPSINVMIVAVIGCAVMMLPGVEIFDVKTFLRENSWDSFFLVGTIMSIANAMVQNGVSSWMISMLPSLHMPIVPFIAFTVVFMFVMLLIIPVASSITALMVPTLIAICATVGVSPALVVLAAALCSCNCYLLPLDTVTLIAYSKGYFSMTDMARSTFFLQLWVVIVISLWLPVVGEIFGMI